MKADKNVFPYKLRNWNGDVTVYMGLTARDYIAIQAVAGLLANPNHALISEECISKMAYKIADAMIKQSEVPHEQSV